MIRSFVVLWYASQKPGRIDITDTKSYCTTTLPLRCGCNRGRASLISSPASESSMTNTNYIPCLTLFKWNRAVWAVGARCYLGT